MPYQKEKVRSKERTVARVIAAATAEFAQRGYSGTSLSRIARRARCSKAVIFSYIGSKEKLYRTIINHNYAELSKRETVYGDLRADSAEQLLHSILSELFRFNLENPTFAKLVAWENLAGGKHLQPDKAKAARAPGLESLKGALRRAQSEGLLRAEVDVDKLVYALQAITVVYFTNRHTMKLLTGIDFDSPSTVQDFIRFYSSVLAQGVATKCTAKRRHCGEEGDFT